jgi:anti-anti-sigma regulatory factor
MEIKVSTENGRVPVTVLQVEGNIDSGSYEEFELQVDKLIKDGARYILIDLAQAPFVSSAGYLKLLNLSPEIRTAFETSGFDMYMETFNDLEIAIASF